MWPKNSGKEGICNCAVVWDQWSWQIYIVSTAGWKNPLVWLVFPGPYQKMMPDGSTVGKSNTQPPEVGSNAAEFIRPRQMAIEGFKAQSEMVIDSLDRLITAWEEQNFCMAIQDSPVVPIGRSPRTDVLLKAEKAVLESGSSVYMRRDVQEIFKMTPHDKQVMMFSATLSKEIRLECGFLMGLMLDALPVNICKETLDGPESQLKGCSSIIHFVLDSITFRKAPNMLYCDISSFQPMEIYVDDEAKLTLHGLVQGHSDISLVELANETVKEDDRAVLLEWGGLQSASPKARSSPVTSHVVRAIIHHDKSPISGKSILYLNRHQTEEWKGWMQSSDLSNVKRVLTRAQENPSQHFSFEMTGGESVAKCIVISRHQDEHGDVGNNNIDSDSVVARTFLIRTKTEEDRKKLAAAGGLVEADESSFSFGGRASSKNLPSGANIQKLTIFSYVQEANALVSCREERMFSSKVAGLVVADAQSSSEMHESDSPAAAAGLLLPPLWLMLAGLLLLMQCCCEAAATRCWFAG
ncbi:unnamed protein product [Camellia sinensis]